MAKKLKIYLANLDITVPVQQHFAADGQVSVRTNDIPEKVRRAAGLPAGKTVKYWYGENAGGNKLIDGTEETEEVRKARETVEKIAQHIETLSTGVSVVLEGRLNKRAVVILLASASGLSQEVCTKVLNAVAELDKTFLKQK